MNEQEGHINQFLDSSTYHQLSANQQKHAQDILTRFTQHMLDEQQLADTAWTPQAVKDVMVGDFIADPALTNQFGIAVAPVLKAYLSFLKVDNQKELAKAIDAQRTNMNQCRKVHQTWQKLHGEPSSKPAAKPVDQSKKTVKAKHEPKPWTKERFTEFRDRTVRAVAVEPEFQNQVLGGAEQQYLVKQLISLMAQEFEEYPGSWEFHDLRRALGMMMPLDPEITSKQIKYIVPTAQSLFAYLKRTGQIDNDQYETATRSIAEMQPSQDMLAGLNRKDRETQLMLSFIRSNGVNTDDVKTAEKWMDDHREEVAAFMRTLLNPWSEYEHEQMVKHQHEAVLQPARHEQVSVKHRVPKGIKFSRKKRRKKRHK